MSLVKYATLFFEIKRVKDFCAYGEVPLGRRPYYPDDPVNPVKNYFTVN